MLNNLTCPHCNGIDPKMMKRGKERVLMHCEYCESDFVISDADTMFLINYELEVEQKRIEEEQKRIEEEQKKAEEIENRKLNRINRIKANIEEHTEKYLKAKEDWSNYNTLAVISCIIAAICCIPCVEFPFFFFVVGGIFLPVLAVEIHDIVKVNKKALEEDEIIERLNAELKRVEN